MPRVGKKHFSYDEDGYAKARALSEKTGEPMVTGYAQGGTAADFVSDKERQKLEDDYLANSAAVNPEFAYDRASYELDQGEGTNRMKKAKRMAGGGEVEVAIPDSAGGPSQMRGAGAATKGTKFSGVF